MPAAKAFTAATSGWTFSDMPSGAYSHIQNDGGSHGAIAVTREGLNPSTPAWLCYFAVDDIESATHRAVTADATLRIPPREEPGGDLAVFDDPTGETFALIRLDRTED